MPNIQNISRQDIVTGNHFDPGTNTLLIQIADPPGNFPTPRHTFHTVYRFDFLDTDDAEDEFAINEDQASQIANALRFAKENDMNVIVHCHAGISRSGAIAECGVMMGFDIQINTRIPNYRVKTMVMGHLGLRFDCDKSAFSQ